MRNQKVLLDNQNYTELDNYLVERKVRKIFLVCIKSISRLKINAYFEGLEERLGINSRRWRERDGCGQMY